MRTTVKAALTAALVAAGTTLFAASPALANFDYSCFGYQGRFLTGSHVRSGDWNLDGNRDECFGIGTDRRVFHAWPNSGGWQVMPHNGLADDIMYVHRTNNGSRRVAVHTNSQGNYYSYLPPGGGWNGWFSCDSHCSYLQ